MAENSKTILIDNSPKILAAFREQVQLGLKAIGAEAEGYAKAECPVDTGRLRNSITYATAEEHSKGNDRWDKGATASATDADMAEHAEPDKNSVYIGTNVEYAVNVEYHDMKHSTGRAHFLKNAAANHSARYKEIMEAALKAGEVPTT